MGLNIIVMLTFFLFLCITAFILYYFKIGWFIVKNGVKAMWFIAKVVAVIAVIAYFYNGCTFN